MIGASDNVAYLDKVSAGPLDAFQAIASSDSTLTLVQASPTISPSLGARAVVAIAWAGCGLLAAYFMKRRGHEFRSLAILGFVLGPLYIPLALNYARSERDVQPLRLANGHSGGGSLDVLIGLRGSADCMSDALRVLALLGPRIGRVTIAAAIDYESASSNDWCGVKSTAAVELELASSVASLSFQPETVIVAGLPDQAFVRYASQNGHHLLLMTDGDRNEDGSPGAVTTMLVPPSEVAG